MTAIRVVRQGKKGKTDRLPLYVEFYINREKIRIAVRLSVTSKEWDEQNEVIKGRDKESKDKYGLEKVMGGMRGNTTLKGITRLDLNIE